MKTRRLRLRPAVDRCLGGGNPPLRRWGMKGKYDSILFRALTPAEDEEFRQWARDWNRDHPDEQPSDLWHPVVRAEIQKVRERGKVE